MPPNQTEVALAKITDTGRFEKLATAILREANPNYRGLVHPGVNLDGKTVTSPVDGIVFRTDTTPPHAYTAHHTTTAKDGLATKWLFDPATVKPSKSKTPRPSGDLTKALQLVADQRQRIPGLEATVILTTNSEPDASLVADVSARAAAAGVAIDIWSRSSLAHFLDNDPVGQWIRTKEFGTLPELLSRELLLDLSRKSISQFDAGDILDARIERAFTATLDSAATRPFTFLVAPSGMGKSVAAHQWLRHQVNCDRFGLVLSDAVVAEAQTLSDAIELTLRKLLPSLRAGSAADALRLATATQPLCLIVEDINRSGQPARLAERILGWTRQSRKEGETSTPDRIRIVCPAWPSVLTMMTEQSQKSAQPNSIYIAAFDPEEGSRAVQKRAALSGHPVSDLTARAVSSALGHDPLLIALHDAGELPAAGDVITNYVAGMLRQVAQLNPDNAASDYSDALQAFAISALLKRNFEPFWSDVGEWGDLGPERVRRLRHLLHDGRLMRSSGAPGSERISYRHDRVREAILANGASALSRSKDPSVHVLGDPFYAEIIARALARGGIEGGAHRIRETNPLALFLALRFVEWASALHADILAELRLWLAEPGTHTLAFQHLRWEALSALAQTDGKEVPEIVGLIRDYTFTREQALFRNGILLGGIGLCASLEPGTHAAWRDDQIEHARQKFGPTYLDELDSFLRHPLNDATRVGALRLAGHFAAESLADAISCSWSADTKRLDHLADYMWAAAQCCGGEPQKRLEPICAAWATLPHSEDSSKPSPRDDVMSHHVRFAFRRRPPRSAIAYLVDRASQDDLRWPITYMLSEVDDPVAIRHQVDDTAVRMRKAAETGGFVFFSSRLADIWGDRRIGAPMSDTSRRMLETLWNDQSADQYVRRFDCGPRHTSRMISKSSAQFKAVKASLTAY